MPSRAREGSTTSFKSLYCSATSACASRLTASKTSAALRASGPASCRPRRMLSFSPATRISKNSSRFEDTMVMKRSRSRSGTASSAACASTRRLKARMPSSRLTNCAGVTVRRFMGALILSVPCYRSQTMAKQETLAAVDLGSNSFHLLIGRVVEHQIYPLDAVREVVRLGGGLTVDKRIDRATQAAALEALAKFAERLHGFARQSVRAVGTNALRVAKNGSAFLREARAVLGFPIEVISGREEARLIYLGVAHSLPVAAPGSKPSRRLVVDIGGGSTEFIIGTGLEPQLTESL